MRGPRHIGPVIERALLDSAVTVIRYNAPRIATRDPELSDGHLRAVFAAVRHLHETAARLMEAAARG